jgi:hypothetical protein
MVASNIVGQWGTAKGATLVPVQVVKGVNYDIVQGIRLIWRHVGAHKTSKAVSTISTNLGTIPTSPHRIGF